jgi:hypothetical protein
MPLKCWTRAKKDGGQYTTCDDGKKKLEKPKKKNIKFNVKKAEPKKKNIKFNVKKAPKTYTTKGGIKVDLEKAKKAGIKVKQQKKPKFNVKKVEEARPVIKMTSFPKKPKFNVKGTQATQEQINGWGGSEPTGYDWTKHPGYIRA